MQLLARDVVPEFCRKPVLVLGCGNVLYGDDGFGPAVVERLDEELPDEHRESVCVMDVGTSARTVLFTLTLSEVRPRRLVVVDAVDMGRDPGEVFALSLDDVPMKKLDDFSMHQIPTSNLLRELRDACGVEVAIIACQVAGVPDRVAPGLSAAVRSAVPRACQTIIGEVRQHDANRDDRLRRCQADPQRPHAAR